MNRKTGKALKKAVITIAVLIAAIVVSLGGFCIYHQSRLKKEYSTINHIAGQYVEVDGHNMNVYVEGEGEKTLVFLSGFGTPSPVLDFKPLYSRLSDRYRIVVIEKFGYGYSDEYPGDRSVETIVDQNRQALEELNIEGPYILTAHSAGGIEAIWWAVHYPDEVEAIIGIDSNIPSQYENYRSPVDLEEQEPQDIDECISSMALNDFFMYKIGLFRLMMPPSLLPGLSSEELSEAEREQYSALAYTMYCQGSGATFQRESIMTEHSLECLRDYVNTPLPDIPTLFFVSDGSVMEQIMEPEIWKKIHEDYIEEITNGVIIYLECGHYIHVEEPDVVAENMIGFIDSLGGGQ